MAPAGRSKNASTATAATKANRKTAAGRAGVPAKHGMSDDDHRELAKQQYESEGEIEVDQKARVSRSEDHTGEIGAYVQAWVFVCKPGRR